MKTEVLRRVRRTFNSDLVPQSVNRHNIKSWCRSVRLLGDRWLLAHPARRGHA